MKLFKASAPLLLLFLSFQLAYGQTGTVRGFVYDKESGEPVIFVSVFINGTSFGATTDNNGFYSIPQIPAGDYKISVSGIEYDSTSAAISIEPDKITLQSFFLDKRTVELEQINVSAERQEAKTEVQVSKVKIKAQEISKIPSIGGEPDIAQFLQIIPGIIFTGDQGGQLYIRGGSPIQTKVLMDGVTIYNPFHSIGLFSVFETDALRSVDVYTGGFGAEYGGRISAIVDIKTKDGNKKRLAGKLSGSPFMAKALLEGPLMKLKENGSSISFLLNTKISYLDKTSESLYSYVDNGDIPFSFSDYYGKLSFNAASGSKFNMFGFHYKDNATYQGVSEFGWTSLGIGSNFNIVPGQSKVLINGNFAYSNYDMELSEGDGPPRTSSVGGFNIGMNFNYFIKNGDFKYGFEVNGFKTKFEFFNSQGLRIDQDQNTTELAFFFNFKKVIKEKFVIEPGLRMQYYASLSAASFEPRLGMKYNVTDNVRLKLAGGLYSQNLISGRSDRDVVNLFTSFLSGPDGKLTEPDGGQSKNNLQKAAHAVFGVEYNPTNFLEINIEPYYKRFSRLININREKVSPQESDFMIETGDAYGLDFLVKFDYKHFYVWTAYSLGYVKRYNGDQTYYPHYDRRHNLNLVTTYTFGKNPEWEVSARWNFGSGFPFTRTQAFYPDFGTNFIDDGITVDYTTANTQNEEGIGILYEEDLDGGRLPSYHRLDFSIKSTIKLSKHTSLDITASVTNVYNRDNIFFFDRIRFERVNQLPILPSLAVGFRF